MPALWHLFLAGERSRAAQVFTAHRSRSRCGRISALLWLELCLRSAAVSSALYHTALLSALTFPAQVLPGALRLQHPPAPGLARGAAVGARGLCRALPRPWVGISSSSKEKPCAGPAGGGPWPCPARPERPRCGSSVRGQRPRIPAPRISRAEHPQPRASPAPSEGPWVRGPHPLPRARSGGAGRCRAPRAVPAAGGEGTSSGSGSAPAGAQPGMASGAGLLGQLLGPSARGKEKQVQQRSFPFPQKNNKPKQPTKKTSSTGRCAPAHGREIENR